MESKNKPPSDSFRAILDSDTSQYSLELTVLLLIVFGGLLFLMGRPLISETGTIRIWVGNVVSPEVSQHFFDWYSLSHIAHGLLFYWVLSKVAPSWSAGAWVLFAVGFEGGWELVENTDYVIEYYRQNTASVEYTGDTIINSMMDIVSMIVGFTWARFSPVSGSLGLFVALEVWLIYWIRDSFLLNIIMFCYPIEAIRNWQMAIVG